ncbi:hypothetical protein PV327_011641 [Microctonus hyperodae]|uniref:Uncharacterized protein n=1 Tax=Microctonus hyperodae TaxID=165561 RepID=A0AA39FGU8_MICHY|nr:hypothetical protein PV327_011641 [Microctonus hyperodae]
MESLPYLIFTIHIPMEWLAIDTTYNNLLTYLMNTTEDYFNIHGTYEGLVIDIMGIQSILIINITRRIIWFRRIRIEDDLRPPTVQYFPQLAPQSLEEEWHFIANDAINMNNNVSDDMNMNMDNDVSDDMNMDDNGDNNGDNFDMEEYYLQNWIAADSESSECSEDSGICMLYDDDADDDYDDDDIN